MAIDFNNLFNQLKTEIIALAKSTFKDFATEAASDGTSLLHIIESDLQKYTQELANGEITPEQFRILLLGNEDLVKMSALTQAGLAQAKADAFRTEVFNTIVNTVLGAI
jgi:hypothetical protein